MLSYENSFYELSLAIGVSRPWPCTHPSPLFFPSAETKPISQGHYQRWHRNLKCWGGTCVNRFSPLTFSGLIHVVGCWWPANCACHFSTLIQACLPPYPSMQTRCCYMRTRGRRSGTTLRHPPLRNSSLTMRRQLGMTDCTLCLD